MIRQVKQMMGVGLRFGLGMLGVMKLVRAVLVPVVLVPVVLVPVVLVPVIMVPVRAAADTTVIIDDVMSLRFARGSFNAESFEGELHDFTVLVDGRDLMTGAYLMIKPAPASETADNPDVVFIRELEMRDLRLVGEVLPDKAEVTIERITGRNMDLSELISGYDAGRNREFSLRDLTFADAALFDGPSQLRIDGIKILVADAGFDEAYQRAEQAKVAAAKAEARRRIMVKAARMHITAIVAIGSMEYGGDGGSTGGADGAGGTAGGGMGAARSGAGRGACWSRGGRWHCRSARRWRACSPRDAAVHRRATDGQ